MSMEFNDVSEWGLVMYRILIVDDEKIGRRGVHFLLDRMDESFDIVEAKNGKEALQYIHERTFDILLTDIKMPFIDGIELIRLTKEIQPDMKIAIFSGYSDFEYAKTALSMGVLEYILKPVNPEEFVLTMKKIIRQVDASSLAYEHKQQEHEMIKDYILNNLVNGNSQKAIVKRVGQPLHQYIKEYKRIILLELKENFFDRAELLEEQLKHEIHVPFDYLNLNLNQSLFFFVEDQNSKLQAVAKKIYHVLQVQYNASGYLVVSQTLNSLSEIKKRVEKMEDILEGMYYHPEKHFYSEEEQETLSVNPDEDIDALTRKIAHSLKMKDVEHIREDLSKFIATYSQQNEFSIDYTKFMLAPLIKELKGALTKIDEQTVDSWIVKFYRAGDLKSMKELIDELVDTLGQEFALSAKESRQEVKDVSHYVYQHYNLDLSVDMLADYVCLAPSYLSHIFKKETGENLGKFIKRVRMEKAKEMLEETHEKIVAIAVAVGYSNVSYFCQSFREYYGISPQKYRNQGDDSC